MTALAQAHDEMRERAFQTILRNRVQRGGIMARRAGLVKKGEDGRGVQSRWYAQTLYKRILDIMHVRRHITFVHGNGLDVMRANADRSNCVYFIDPPYTVGNKRAGSRLYTHSVVDHEELFRIAASCAGDFLMTYEDAPELHDIARYHNFDTHVIPMKNGHHERMTELLVGRDLDWARD